MHPLRRYRKQYRLSLETFAVEVGVTAATISRIENRKHGVTLSLALRIQTATKGKVRPEDLLVENVA